MIAVIWGFFGGVLVGYVIDREREYRLWRRLWRPTGPANTTIPTVTELNRPTWMEDA